MPTETITIDAYVSRTLMRDLVGHDHKPAAFLVYLWLAIESQRTGSPVAISYASLAEETGLSRSATQTAVSWLMQRKLLAAQRASAKATPVYTVLQPWRRSKKG